MPEIKHQFERNIVCPHCGYEFNNSWELGDDGELDCGQCDTPFMFMRHVEVTYSTYFKEPEPKKITEQRERDASDEADFNSWFEASRD